MPQAVIRLAEGRVRPPDAGVADEDVDRLAAKRNGERVDCGEIGDIERKNANVSVDGARGLRCRGIEARRENPAAVRRILARELDAQSRIAARYQNACHRSGSSHRSYLIAPLAPAA
jgi:hypothetical protein